MRPMASAGQQTVQSPTSSSSPSQSGSAASNKARRVEVVIDGVWGIEFDDEIGFEFGKLMNARYFY